MSLYLCSCIYRLWITSLGLRHNIFYFNFMLKKRHHKYSTNLNSMKLCRTSRLFHFDLLSCLARQLKIQWVSVYFSFKNSVSLSYLSNTFFFFLSIFYTTTLFFYFGKLFLCKFLWKIKFLSPPKAEILVTLFLMPTLCAG